MPRDEPPPVPRRAVDQIGGVRSGQGERRLDEHVLLGVDCTTGELVVGRRRGRDDDGVEGLVVKELVDVVSRPHGPEARLEAEKGSRALIAQPAQLCRRQLVEGAHE